MATLKTVTGKLKLSSSNNGATTTANNQLTFLDTNTSINANDLMGQIVFDTSDTTNTGTAAKIQTRATNTLGSGELQIWSGTPGGINKNVHFRGDQSVFNEDSNDMDFRVEGDSETHALFVDASTDRVGIGNSSPSYNLHIGTTNSENLGIGWMRMETFAVAIPDSGTTRWYKIANYATGIMLQGQLFMSSARNGGAHQTNGARMQHGSLAGYNGSVNTGDWGDVGTNYGHTTYYIEVGTDDHAYLRVTGSIYGGTVYGVFQGRANWTYDGSYVTSAP